MEKKATIILEPRKHQGMYTLVREAPKHVVLRGSMEYFVLNLLVKLIDVGFKPGNHFRAMLWSHLQIVVGYIIV